MKKKDNDDEGIKKQEEIILAKKENTKFKINSGNFDVEYFKYPEKDNGIYDIRIYKKGLNMDSIYLHRIDELNILLEILKIVKSDLE